MKSWEEIIRIPKPFCTSIDYSGFINELLHRKHPEFLTRKKKFSNDFGICLNYFLPAYKRSRVYIKTLR